MTDFAYDVVRYSNYPYAQTHPDRLATVAILHGLEPPDSSSGRVLEIGCGAGGNLMAMAASAPGITALGIDLAEGPIADGQAAIAEIGLRNIELRQGDVMELADGRLGHFDYIVAHGVYGWIPAPARDALLATIRASLAPGGVAYVSFNTHPGGYFRRMLRDAGLWHARGVDQRDELARAEKAQELFKFLSEHRASSADTYGALLDRELPALADGPLYRLVHDDLSDNWYPLWFAEFAEHAGGHGLSYVGEADLYGLRTEMLPEGVGPAVWELAGGDRIAFENYSDMLTARHFRQSVLCRTEDAGPVSAEPEPGLTRRLHWAVRPSAEPFEVGLLADVYAELDTRRAQTVSFAELQKRLGADADALADALLDGFRRERLIPHAGPLRAASEVGEYPLASRLARWQAAHGPELTSLAYTTVRMEEPAARLLITLLDGTLDRAGVRAELKARTDLELSASDLDNNLNELARLFLMER
jgi:SAM-dependent methyltransferase